MDEVYPTNKWSAGELGVRDTDVAQFTKRNSVANWWVGEGQLATG